MCLVASVLAAQPQSRLRAALRPAPVVYVGSAAEDRLRLDQLRGLRPSHDWLFRTAMQYGDTSIEPGKPLSASSFLDRCTFAVVPPQTGLLYNSMLPFERNDGGVWAGRGVTVHAAAGMRANCGLVRVMLVPEIWHARNAMFPILATEVSWLSGFSSPFYAGLDASADLPLRFGSRPITMIEPGQSAIEVDAADARITFGAGTQAQWWGPGIRNALLISNHAAGIPSAYVRTTSPLRVPFGFFSARWLVGALTESRYYDFDPKNDIRSLSALGVSFAPSADSNLTFSVSRAVYGSVSDAGAVIGHFFDAVSSAWGGDSTEQMTALAARWVMPESGLETYLEWARTTHPKSFRELLAAPHYSQGYTLGLQWLSQTDRARTAWRVQGEITNLEMLRRERGVEPPSFYVSAQVPQGYTQRGQVIGAAIGPSSSQFFAVDRLRPSWTAGLFIGRIRWNGDQYYRRPTSNLPFARDISLYMGLRGAQRIGAFDLSAEVLREKRLNYLFQSAVGGYGEDHTFDLANTSFRVLITPR